MTYRIEIAKPAAKFIRSLPAPDKERMLRAIHKLPEEGDIKQMKGAKVHRTGRAVPQGALPRAKMGSSGRYARRDSGHYGANAVQPAFGGSPPDCRIELFESLPAQSKSRSSPLGMTCFLVRQKGLEPPTLGTGIRCSIH